MYFFLYGCGDHRDLHVLTPSFPTRRSFDLWTGHEARISLVEPQDGRKQFTGTLKGVEGDVITFSDRKLGDLSIPFDNVHGAKLMLTDALINATMPLYTEGADRSEKSRVGIECVGPCGSGWSHYH